ncbi:NAD-P-binding protein [Rickenella mellea]|uniref:NAD-P-binding protein n=1 Tax=Rickenella mellea TaxID=50990 RepID=A0A4Y7PXU1_9AGAM|nr:NAD-P-binding protein [Rickenella mellea]
MQTVLVVGATGQTGRSIVAGLLESNNFRVAAVIRPESVHKDIVNELRNSGVDIRVVDLGNIDHRLDDALQGIHAVVSAISASKLDLQRPIVDAAKKAGVKRFVPSDFGSACTRGVRPRFDQKLDIHEYIKSSGIPYTFIDVGWWMQLILPFTDKNLTLYEGLRCMYEGNRQLYEGNFKTALTDLRDIGRFVARIIADPRTFNAYIFCGGEELTQQEIFDISEKVTGKTVEIIPVSMWIRGDNRMDNARKIEYGGAMDAKALYPDFSPRRLIDFAREFYG